MEELIEYNCDRFSILIRNGIVYFTFLEEIVDFSLVDDAIIKRLELANGRTFPVFSDLRVVKNSSREARERMASMDGGRGVSAVAVLVNSKVQRVIYNFFHSIYKAPAPAKLFTDKEKALAWLEQYK